MRVLFRVLVVAAVGAWLAGCETWKPEIFGQSLVADQPPPAVETTGALPAPVGAVAGAEAVTRGDPNDDLNLGKRHFSEGDFGLAERHFRRAIEKAPVERRDAVEAWMGLAASYDRLRRFELADRAYAQALKIAGPIPEILNNQGYSYLMRGDYPRARAKLTAAYARDPKNPYILANLDLLEKSVRRR